MHRFSMTLRRALCIAVAAGCVAAPTASAQEPLPPQIGEPSAPSILAPEATALACGTWQYRVNEPATVRHTPGGTVKANLDPFPLQSDADGYLANITVRDGSWYYGNFYVTYKTAPEAPGWLTTGWILASQLSYIRCW